MQCKFRSSLFTTQYLVFFLTLISVWCLPVSWARYSIRHVLPAPTCPDTITGSQLETAIATFCRAESIDSTATTVLTAAVFSDPVVTGLSLGSRIPHTEMRLSCRSELDMRHLPVDVLVLDCSIIWQPSLPADWQVPCMSLSKASCLQRNRWIMREI